MSKTKTNGVQWANKTDLQGELGLSKGLTTDIENGTQTNTVYTGGDTRIQLDRDKAGAVDQRYDVGGHVGYKTEQNTAVGNQEFDRSLDTQVGVGGTRIVHADGKKHDAIETGVSSKGASKTTTHLDDGSHARTWSGEAGVSHELQMRDNGNVNIVKANAGVDRDVRRVTELDDGKRTTDYNVGGSVSERMRVNKDGKRSHRITSEAHAGAGTKRVIELDDGKRTNLVKGEVESLIC